MYCYHSPPSTRSRSPSSRFISRMHSSLMPVLQLKSSSRKLVLDRSASARAPAPASEISLQLRFNFVKVSLVRSAPASACPTRSQPSGLSRPTPHVSSSGVPCLSMTSQSSSPLSVWIAPCDDIPRHVVQGPTPTPHAERADAGGERSQDCQALQGHHHDPQNA